LWTAAKPSFAIGSSAAESGETALYCLTRRESALIISEFQGGAENPVGESLTIEVRNSPHAIALASVEAEVWLQSYHPSPKVLNLVLLAIEELVSNCIRYGYDDSEEHTVVIVLWMNDSNLTMKVIDDGHPFDPLTLPPPDFSLDIQDRPTGGLGIHLLRQLADHIEYERRDGTNRLTLTKRMR
jgi:serine/threonine-protein kinase RsbW